MVDLKTRAIATDDNFEKLLAAHIEAAIAQMRLALRIEEDVVGAAEGLTRWIQNANLGMIVGPEPSGLPGAVVVSGNTMAPDQIKVERRGDFVVFEFTAKDLFSSSQVAEAKFHEAIVSAVRGSLHLAKAVELDPAVMPIVNAVQLALPDARRRASEETIGRLVAALVETHDPLASINADIDAANAAAQVRFMNNFQTYSAEEVTKIAGSTAKNVSQTASRWKSQGKIFSVLFQGRERFPGFQFKDGRPIPVIGEILAALPETMSPWETAFWFVSTNGWLDGASPRDCLKMSDRVLGAARREREAVVG